MKSGQWWLLAAFAATAVGTQSCSDDSASDASAPDDTGGSAGEGVSTGGRSTGGARNGGSPSGGSVADTGGVGADAGDAGRAGSGGEAAESGSAGGSGAPEEGGAGAGTVGGSPDSAGAGAGPGGGDGEGGGGASGGTDAEGGAGMDGGTQGAAGAPLGPDPTCHCSSVSLDAINCDIDDPSRLCEPADCAENGEDYCRFGCTLDEILEDVRFICELPSDYTYGEYSECDDGTIRVSWQYDTFETGHRFDFDAETFELLYGTIDGYVAPLCRLQPEDSTGSIDYGTRSPNDAECDSCSLCDDCAVVDGRTALP